MVRHPIYGGITLAVFGLAAITYNETRLLLAIIHAMVMDYKVGARLDRQLLPWKSVAVGAAWIYCYGVWLVVGRQLQWCLLVHRLRLIEHSRCASTSQRFGSLPMICEQTVW